MDLETFAITEEGRVYSLRGHARPTLLGHIAGLVREGTPSGRKIRAWWEARLASEEPVENIELTRGGEFYFVRPAGATVEGEVLQGAAEQIAAD